jgi:hypothetical protein
LKTSPKSWYPPNIITTLFLLKSNNQKLLQVNTNKLQPSPKLHVLVTCSFEVIIYVHNIECKQHTKQFVCTFKKGNMNVLTIKCYYLWLWESIDLLNCILHPIYMSWLRIGIWHSYIIFIVLNLNMSHFYIKCYPSRSTYMTYITLSIYIVNIYIVYLPIFNTYPHLLTPQ